MSSCEELYDSGTSISSCSSNFKRRDAIIEIPIEAFTSNNEQLVHSQWQDFLAVLKWQQAFQIIVATATFIAGAGVGQEILHDPLATAEGVLNAPVVVSQVAIILTNTWQLRHPQTFETPHLLALIEHLTIFASAFALLSHIALSLLFSLPRFPVCVEPISSYGGATLLHLLLILTHALQAAVLKWDTIQAFLHLQLQRLCDRIYTWHPDSKMENALQLSERRRELESEKQDNHHHQHHHRSDKEEGPQVTTCCHGGGTGFAAIMADIIAHAVSLPTFFTAWVLQKCDIYVNDLAVAWTVDLSTLVLLACIMHSSTKAGVTAWKAIASGQGGGRAGGCGDLKPGAKS